jgi:hypothetical protein
MNKRGRTRMLLFLLLVACVGNVVFTKAEKGALGE